MCPWATKAGDSPTAVVGCARLSCGRYPIILDKASLVALPDATAGGCTNRPGTWTPRSARLRDRPAGNVMCYTPDFAKLRRSDALAPRNAAFLCMALPPPAPSQAKITMLAVGISFPFFSQVEVLARTLSEVPGFAGGAVLRVNGDEVAEEPFIVEQVTHALLSARCHGALLDRRWVRHWKREWRRGYLLCCR